MKSSRGNTIGNWLLPCALLALLALLPFLVPHAPASFDLVPTPKAAALVAWACGAGALLIPLLWRFPALRAPSLLAVSGFALFTWQAGLRASLTVGLSALAWTWYCRLIPGILPRLMLFIPVAGAAFYLRVTGYFELGFWWCYVHFLKFLAIALCPERDRLKPAITCSYFFSFPFLLGPLACEWMTLEDYARCLRFEISRERSREGLAFLLWGAMLLLGASLIASPSLGAHFPHLQLSPDFFDPQKPFAPAYLGAYFFLLTFARRAGSSALAAGYFRLMGCPLPYDFQLQRPPLTYLEFCQRYHGNAKSFLSRFVFLPVTMATSPKTGWRFATAAGLGAALFAAATAHYFSFIPVAGVPFRASYSLPGTLNHRLWEGSFIGLSLAAWWCGQRLLSRAPGPWANTARGALHALQATLTALLVAFFFFNTYAQAWLGWPNARFLRAISVGLFENP